MEEGRRGSLKCILTDGAFKTSGIDLDQPDGPANAVRQKRPVASPTSFLIQETSSA